MQPENDVIANGPLRGRSRKSLLTESKLCSKPRAKDNRDYFCDYWELSYFRGGKALRRVLSMIFLSESERKGDKGYTY